MKQISILQKPSLLEPTRAGGHDMGLQPKSYDSRSYI